LLLKTAKEVNVTLPLPELHTHLTPPFTKPVLLNVVAIIRLPLLLSCPELESGFRIVTVCSSRINLRSDGPGGTTIESGGQFNNNFAAGNGQLNSERTFVVHGTLTNFGGLRHGNGIMEISAGTVNNTGSNAVFENQFGAEIKINNGGIFRNEDDATLDIDGTITIELGQLANVGGTVNNKFFNGRINNNMGDILNSLGGTINNEIGTIIINNGTFTIGANSSVNNNGTANNSGTIDVFGVLDSSGDLLNPGTIKKQCDATITISGTFSGNAVEDVCEIGSSTWIGGNGTWNSPENWSPIGIPTSTDEIIIDGNSSKNSIVTLDVNVTIGKSIEVNSGDSLVVDAGSILDLTNATAIIDGILENGGVVKIKQSDLSQFGGSIILNHDLSIWNYDTGIWLSDGSNVSYNGTDVIIKNVNHTAIGGTMTADNVTFTLKVSGSMSIFGVRLL